jgi:oligopeptide/dipeptide ABC transporter ATP-binding protein
LLSSVPSIDPAKRRQRVLLPGDVPSPIHPPSGCRFHPRCPWAQPVCRAESPRQLELDGHMVRCHAAEKDLLGAGEYDLPQRRTLNDSGD